MFKILKGTKWTKDSMAGQPRETLVAQFNELSLKMAFREFLLLNVNSEYPEKNMLHRDFHTHMVANIFLQ